ncbi:hypothetical protein HPB52_004437 [Rhipicephalus sanguineus]|uniref:Uncharacterized protein n=1 Tax=Rhipicephalus sanguineus TaxID=34632 RepID=A0A9D4SSF2_RHISA|nr:hypothetical protein HPB52_004437 [Rhipicephalus sanguineus]
MSSAYGESEEGATEALLYSPARGSNSCALRDADKGLEIPLHLSWPTLALRGSGSATSKTGFNGTADSSNFPDLEVRFEPMAKRVPYVGGATFEVVTWQKSAPEAYP